MLFILKCHNAITCQMRNLFIVIKLYVEVFASELKNVANEQIVQLHLFLLVFFFVSLHRLFVHLCVSFLSSFADLPSYYFTHFYLTHICLGDTFTPRDIFCFFCQTFYILKPSKYKASLTILTVLWTSLLQERQRARA